MSYLIYIELLKTVSKIYNKIRKNITQVSGNSRGWNKVILQRKKIVLIKST